MDNTTILWNSITILIILLAIWWIIRHGPGIDMEDKHD